MWTKTVHAGTLAYAPGGRGWLPSAGSSLVLGGLLVIMACASVLDALATQHLVTSGLVNEGNPLMTPLISGGWFMWLRVIGLVVCAGLIWHLSRRFPRLALTTVLCSILLYASVLVWNTVVLVTA